MIKRCILHVGPHKTGSTYLQTSFTINVDRLRERGICYPTEYGSWQGHYPLVELLRQDDPAACRNAFRTLTDTGAETLLLSSETFISLDTRGWRTMRAMLGSTEVTVVFFLRRPSELLLSGWREVMKHGAITLFPEFIATALTGEDHAWMANPNLILARLAAVFGTERLDIESYHAASARPENLFRYFCARWLDWPDAPDPGIRRLNQALDGRTAELLRMLNVLEERRGGAPAPLYKRLIANHAELDPSAILLAMTRHGGFLKLGETRPPFVGYHRGVVERFAAGRDGMHEPVVAELEYVRPDYLTEPGVQDALRALHARLLTLPDPNPWQFNMRYL